MQLNPAQFRLLLAGPRVSRLQPFFEARGFVVDAAVTGSQAQQLLQAAPRHVLLLELELDDMLCADLLQFARAKNLAGSVILLEDPSKSGLIVSTMIRGVDGYVSTPPDEAYLFRVVERQLLAQWALAQSGPSGAELAEEKARGERLVAQERAKVTELVREIASLREEVTRVQKEAREAKSEPKPTPARRAPAPAPAPTAAPPATAAAFQMSAATQVDITQARPAKQNVNDDRTSPAGHQPPAPALLDDGFEDGPQTAPGNPAQAIQELRELDAVLAKASAASGKRKAHPLDEASDLLIELDDSTSATGIDIKKTMDDDSDLLKLDE